MKSHCANCGKEFEHHPILAGTDGGNFIYITCSIKCAHKILAHNADPEYISDCPVCGCQIAVN